jgi:hypothetical protein
MQTLITKYSAELTFDPQQSDRQFLKLVEIYLRDVEKGKMSVEEAIDCATADWERDQESWDF